MCQIENPFLSVTLEALLEKAYRPMQALNH